jgi:hypothetical protein
MHFFFGVALIYEGFDINWLKVHKSRWNYSIYEFYKNDGIEQKQNVW